MKWDMTDRKCARCHLAPTPEGHDACIANLPNVKYACCGHGYIGYVLFNDGRCMRFKDKTGEEIRSMAMQHIHDHDPLPVEDWAWDIKLSDGTIFNKLFAPVRDS